MQSAKLIKALEKEGFFLEFPDYRSTEEMIIEILKENNPRINFALPLLLKKEIDYKKIFSKLNGLQTKEFHKIILISRRILLEEGIESNLGNIVKQNNISAKFSNNEFKEFYDAFKEASIRKSDREQKKIERQTKLRLNLDLNRDLAILFSPAKVRIMQKIFNHEKLTNTELKYYYKAVSKIDKSVLNPNLQDYLRIIEVTKKIY